MYKKALAWSARDIGCWLLDSEVSAEKGLETFRHREQSPHDHAVAEHARCLEASPLVLPSQPEVLDEEFALLALHSSRGRVTTCCSRFHSEFARLWRPASRVFRRRRRLFIGIRW